MFREVRFYDTYTSAISSYWWLYLLLGLNLIVLALLIITFPKMLVFLIGGFLLFDGILFLVVAWKLKKFQKNYKQWKNQWWKPVMS